MKRPVNVKHRRYKVLPLEFPFDCEKRFWDDCVLKENRIEPVFNRNGYYFDRQTGLTWLEINGEAWIYCERKWFQYVLDTSEANNWMDDDVYQSLVVLCRVNLATKKQKQMRQIHVDRLSGKYHSRIAKIGAYRMRKRLTKLIAECKANCTK